MKAILYICAVLTFLASVLVMLGAKSAIHEILAGVAAIVSAACAGSAAIIGAIEGSTKRLENAIADLAPKKASDAPKASAPYKIPGI